MLPNKTIIAFDLDGTLAESKSKMTAEMGELLRRLAKQKIVVVISGGSFRQFETQFLPLFHDDKTMVPFIKNLILLPTSGSQRYEYDKEKKAWEMTDREPLSKEIKQKARKLLEEIIDSGAYDIPKNSKGEIIEDRDTQLSFSALGQLAPLEEKKLWDPKQEKRMKIKALIEPKIPEVIIAIGGTTTLDVLAKGFNKAVGLGRFLKKMGFQKKDMLFVGDGLFPGGNDYPVFEDGIETISVEGPKETAELIGGWVG